MKKHILLAVAVCSAFILKAGDKDLASHGGGGDSKLTIGVSVGAALPMGAYGDKKADTADKIADSATIQHGYASTGFHFDVNAGYLIGGPVGVMVLIGGNMNSYDVATYETVNNRHPVSGETFAVKSYYVGQYLVGPFLALPAGDKLKINIRLLVGLVTASYPTSTITDGSFTDVTTASNASAFGYHFSAGIKYNFSDKLGLAVDLGYTGSSLTYSGYTDTQTAGSNTTTSTSGHKGTMALGLLTASVGIAFNL
ncbi:MAG TPA: hypothetical protein VK890_02265 [Bacteroidia bacterium]|jgi:hypothetical protein|nr:hypothetical protein [Bacteroidia bacterium]